MKKWLRLLIVIFLFGSISAIFLSSCQTTCTRTQTYIKHVPIYHSLKDLRSSFEVTEPRALEQPGKIHVQGDYLFIVERAKGFHLVDNSNISNPVFLKFIQLIGCTDVVSNNNVLYANQGPDIVTLDITNILSIAMINRQENVMNMHLVKEDSVVIDFIEKEIVEVVEDADCGGGRGFGGGFAFNGNLDSRSFVGSGSGGSSASGSMARFAVIGGYLYIVDNTNLRIFSLASPGNPQPSSVVAMSGGVETIYGYNNHLFIGTTTGMRIYKTSNGTAVFVSAFDHARGCDPVVVDNDVAYVTLRGNGSCGEANDELHLIDIANLYQPRLMFSYGMNEPYGLGIRDNLLAICDGEAGLRLFDATKSSTLSDHEFSNEKGMKAYDVIMGDQQIILTAREGIFQYDVSNPSSPIRVSTLYSK